MALRTKVLKFVDVILRVPPLFFIDEIFRIGFGIRIGYGLKVPGNERLFGLKYLDQFENNTTEFDLGGPDSYSIVVYSFFKLILSICGCLIALCIFMLRTKKLLHVYMFILSLGCIFLSHNFNDGFVQYIVNNIANYKLGNLESLWTLLFRPTGLPRLGSLVDEKVFYNFYYNVAIQVVLSVFFLKVHLGPYYKMLNALIPISFTAPTILVIFSLPSSIQSHLAVFSALLPLGNPQILQTEDQDDKSIGTVSAILFYILALQTGLTELEPEDRFVRLCRNFCLLFTALLHFIHNIVNPLLMSLSASHNPALHRHVRALGVCSFLIIYPTLLLVYLWTNLQLSTWLLAVSAFSTEVIVKVTVSLMIYCLFLIDAWRVTFWEKLDDYVYYIRAFGNTIEFCFGIFLFFNGAWILLFESGGGVRAAMMCIHAYFNIWCEAKNGWVVFMKRKTAVKKIESLPEASRDQLREFDDVCAICYQDMISAKITRCNHYFHGVCLRKWLYVQDRCPLCHKILYKFKSKSTGHKSSSSDNNDLIVYMQRDTQEGGSDETSPATTGAPSGSQTREQGSQTDEVSGGFLVSFNQALYPPF
ncbi:protein TRC8 homolog [Diaphorina citri]|uniref:Protein TRC8 homolog n=1 Tax=Diaphorina citri TaxID=121845 RepID=A0A3Q0J4X7_DIACI|nr:protein TRC8 homolog [Diaphorina citri]